MIKTDITHAAERAVAAFEAEITARIASETGEAALASMRVALAVMPAFIRTMASEEERGTASTQIMQANCNLICSMIATLFASTPLCLHHKTMMASLLMLELGTAIERILNGEMLPASKGFFIRETVEVGHA